MAQVRLGINIGVPAPVYVAPQPVHFTFLTLDVRQREIAEKLGFCT